MVCEHEYMNIAPPINDAGYATEPTVMKISEVEDKIKDSQMVSVYQVYLA